MAILNRNALKPKFINGTLPNQQDFYDLIDSCVNQRDDCFFGKWRSGTEYCHGNVVIYEKSLYILLLEPTAADCGSEAEVNNGSPVNVKSASPSGDPDTNALCICSTEIPPCDPRWCKLELHVEDNDWEVPDDGSDVMYAKVYGRIGMGTEAPCARLDIADATEGHYLFGPQGSSELTFAMEHPTPDADGSRAFVRQQIDQQANTWLTAGPLGYVFRKIKSGVEAPTDKWALENIPEDEQLTLLLVTTDVNEQPAAGIGTEGATPQAALDVSYEGRGHIWLHPSYSEQAELIIVNTHQTYIALGVAPSDDAVSEFNTNAAAYCFNFEKDGHNYLGHDPTDLANVLTITQTGNLGICTKTPEYKLVAEGDGGSFCMALSEEIINPVFTITNRMSNNTGQSENYFTLGASDTHAVLKTDSPEGFLLISREEGETEEDSKDIAKGKELLEISPEGKVGIGITPEKYLMDIAGPVASYEFYQRAPEGPNLDRCETMEHVLDDLCKLKTWRYNWKPNTVACDNGDDKFGIDADDLYHCLPELVCESNQERSINYSGMVAVLVQAVKELKHDLEACLERIRDLEKDKY